MWVEKGRKGVKEYRRVDLRGHTISVYTGVGDKPSTSPVYIVAP